MKNKALVAVCDILGFSNLVESKSVSLETLKNEHIEFLKTALANSIHLAEASGRTQPSIGELKLNKDVGFKLFSDTVLLYSVADSKGALLNVVEAVLGLTCQTIFAAPDLRFRIGIDYGDFYCDPENSIYVGRAIVGASKLEKKQEWCGGALTDNAYERIKDDSNATWWFEKYNVPIKNSKKDGCTKNMWAINWTMAKHKKISEKTGWLVKSEYIPDNEDERKKIEEKIENTELFHSKVCKACFPSRVKRTVVG